MMPPSIEDPESILSFWLGTLDADGLAEPAITKRWFTSEASFDAEIRRRFEAEYDAIVAKHRNAWLDAPRGCVAFVIVLDQFSRNMFRGTAKMYAADDLALAAATRAVERTWARALVTEERSFLYMPFMHAEDRTAQDRSVALFEAFRDELHGRARERVASSVGYAHAHRDIIARFGRFPHRNAILGRASTPEEIEFLNQPGSRF